MQPDIQTTITNVLAPLPLKERLWALACSIIEDNPGAVPPVKALVSMAARMASYLTAAQRDEVARHMRAEADETDARVH
jgi:hypothetical protein